MSTHGPLEFIIEIALPWVGRCARSAALGCVLALGGCEGGDAGSPAPAPVEEAAERAPREDHGVLPARPRLARPGRAERASRVSRFAHSAPARRALADAGADASAEVSRPAWCGACHAEPGPSRSLVRDEWALTASAHHDPALRRRAPWHGDRAGPSDQPSACASCHDPFGASRHALRVFDTVEVDGAPAEHLGSGATCASCHRADAERALDRPARAPQADVVLGRGARLATPMDTGAHRFIANTCVRCHMTRPREGDPLRGRAGGHTFAVRAPSGAFNAAACAPCHGDAPAHTIGAGDWDGDGVLGAVEGEHRRALDRAAARLRSRIARLGIRDACGRVAADVTEHQARLHLVDAAGDLLGDCDASGAIEPSEAAVTSSALPRRLADATHDLALLRADGSAGVHNPAYAFRVLAAIERALR